MILVDANLLIYASVDTLPQHQRARIWLDDRLNGAAPVGLPWASLLAFMRITTNPRVFGRPASVSSAWHCGGDGRLPHSITFVACTMIVGGILRPKALAVFRLTNKSNTVGCSTGKSTGFAPFRILSI